jgi:hypothetical protein
MAPDPAQCGDRRRPGGAFKLVPLAPPVLDLVVIALLLLMAVQPWWEVDRPAG